MASFTRRNAWNDGGTFANSDLFWYAKGVGAMQARLLADPNSWWFFAAIHGQYLTRPTIVGFPDWRFIPVPPQVDTAPLPSQQLRDLYWDQCQHQSWYFPPWHRGYLLALEAQIRKAVVDLGGPADWALPYWNYFGPDAQNTIPPAFTAQTLPDGITPNPLFVGARFGPNWDGVIFVTTDANEACQANTVYTGVDAVTPAPGYGGPDTGFWHGGNNLGGNLEQNPHDQVHGDIGGAETEVLFQIATVFIAELELQAISVNLRNAFQASGHALTAQATVQVRTSGSLWRIVDVGQSYFLLNNATQMMIDVIDLRSGLMGDPGTAALDPIFYLHHANIDRMWATWNTTLGNSNPTDSKWLLGPASIGERKFAMPMPLPAVSPWEFTPGDVNTLGQVDYTYDDMPEIVVPQPTFALAQRLMILGVEPTAALAAQGANMESGESAELMGANEGALPVTSSGARATVRMNDEVRGRVFDSLAAASESNVPDRVYLRLENVRGTIDAYKLRVSVNQQNVGTVSLFGLNRASLEDDQHGGGGLTFEFDITGIIDNLFLANALDVNALDVRIEPNHAFVELAQITIGRVSVYRRGA